MTKSTISDEELQQRVAMFQLYNAAEDLKVLEAQLECINYSIRWMTARKGYLEEKIAKLRAGK
jgi:hypothetical protein